VGDIPPVGRVAEASLPHADLGADVVPAGPVGAENPSMGCDLPVLGYS
jgi:hypothetical protein